MKTCEGCGAPFEPHRCSYCLRVTPGGVVPQQRYLSEQSMLLGSFQQSAPWSNRQRGLENCNPYGLASLLGGVR